MATDVGDDREMREAQRDYLDFLDDDVSLFFLNSLKVFVWSSDDKPCGHNKRAVILYITEKNNAAVRLQILGIKSVLSKLMFFSHARNFSR